jgi:hypothetical protein
MLLMLAAAVLLVVVGLLLPLPLTFLCTFYTALTHTYVFVSTLFYFPSSRAKICRCSEYSLVRPYCRAQIL